MVLVYKQLVNIRFLLNIHSFENETYDLFLQMHMPHLRNACAAHSEGLPHPWLNSGFRTPLASAPAREAALGPGHSPPIALP